MPSDQRSALLLAAYSPVVSSGALYPWVPLQATHAISDYHLGRHSDKSLRPAGCTSGCHTLPLQTSLLNDVLSNVAATAEWHDAFIKDAAVAHTVPGHAWQRS